MHAKEREKPVVGRVPRFVQSGSALALLCLVVVGCATKTSEPDYDPSADWNVQVGQPAPGFSLVTTEAEKVRLSELQGKVVVVNFFATWCGPCHTEMSEMKQRLAPLAREDPRLALLTISSLEQPEVVAAFFREHEFPWPCLMDPYGEVFKQYCKTGGIPRMMIVGAQGKIRYLSPVGFSSRAMDKVVQRARVLLAEAPASVSSQTPPGDKT